jgi:hypothetical protein
LKQTKAADQKQREREYLMFAPKPNPARHTARPGEPANPATARLQIGPKEIFHTAMLATNQFKSKPGAMRR